MNLHLSPLPGAFSRYVVAVQYKFEAMGKEWIVPAGFVTDGASIPTLFGVTWMATYQPTDSRVMRASVEHDWFCEHRPAGTWSAGAAERFERVVIEDGGTASKARMMRSAIVKFGPQWDFRLRGDKCPRTQK